VLVDSVYCIERVEIIIKIRHIGVFGYVGVSGHLDDMIKLCEPGGHAWGEWSETRLTLQFVRLWVLPRSTLMSLLTSACVANMRP
jgi:hypothetical protein